MHDKCADADSRLADMHTNDMLNVSHISLFTPCSSMPIKLFPESSNSSFNYVHVSREEAYHNSC